ncbi:unnamed protein product [Fraxinus pennsylvanica]|uniref:LOB domain-containing protein n=1 Tax=Fraxinus pennsylvanica TaxID=56036 RepID=A0AAD1Z3I5_9LAMI|nr:unnamed protein product [Fraxinus pennsylvanica]
MVYSPVQSPARLMAHRRHQRKNYTGKYVLTLFYLVDKTREFQAVHMVFGVSNVTKMVMNLKEEDRKQVGDSLVWKPFAGKRIRCSVPTENRKEFLKLILANSSTPKSI